MADKKFFVTKEELKFWYGYLGSMAKVAEHFGVSKRTVLNYMNKWELWRQPKKADRKPREKSKDTFHKGWTQKGKDGYIFIYMPTHPRANKHGYVPEHTLVMEEHIGRYLTDDEVVHHKDRIKYNNDISNLQLMTKSEHAAYHSSQPRKYVNIDLALKMLKEHTVNEVAKYFNMCGDGLTKRLKKEGVWTPRYNVN